jgi:hypothetical protein
MVSRALTWITACVCAAPVWSTRYLPWTDLPEHVAAMATMARTFDPASPDSATYEIMPFRGQYMLYHGAGALLTLVLRDAVLANRLLLTAVAIAFPHALRAALRALGKDEAAVVFAALPFLSRPLFVGLLPYVASIPLCLYGVALVARRHARPTTANGVLLALVGLALFFTHVSATVVFFGAAALLEALLAARSDDSAMGTWVRRRIAALAWLVPSILALGAWTLIGKITFGESIASPGEVGRMSPFRALRALPLWSFDVLRSHVDEACGAAWWLALAILVVLASLQHARRPAETSERDFRSLLARLDPAFAPLAAVLVAYAVTPFRVGAAGMLNVRLAPLVALAAVLTAGLTASAWRRVLIGIGLGAGLVHSTNASLEMRALAREHVAELDQILGAIPDGARLVSLMFDARRTRTHVDPYPFVGSYHRARHAGVAGYSFSDLPHWPVQYREQKRPPPKPAALWIYHPCVYLHSVDGAYYDYVLVGGPVDPFAKKPLGPALREVVRVPGWVLYAKTDGAWAGPDVGPCEDQRAELAPYP